jgi:hypothetical protein
LHRHLSSSALGQVDPAVQLSDNDGPDVGAQAITLTPVDQPGFAPGSGGWRKKRCAWPQIRRLTAIINLR